MPADPILAKGHIRFIEARFPAVAASQLDITRRLTDHLWKLREAQERRLAEAAAPLRQEDAAQPAVGIRKAKGADADGAKDDDLFLPPADRVLTRTASTISLTAADRSKIDRRARRLFHRREAASGMKHLKKEDRDRLEVLARGVRLAVIPSEHRADELAAELHGEFPWLAPATEVVWRAMRRSVREGWPGFRMPPLLLDGPVGIGKSVWARWLGTLIEAPSLVVEATNQNASFGIVGSQRSPRPCAPSLERGLGG